MSNNNKKKQFSSSRKMPEQKNPVIEKNIGAQKEISSTKTVDKAPEQKNPVIEKNIGAQKEISSTKTVDKAPEQKNPVIEKNIGAQKEISSTKTIGKAPEQENPAGGKGTEPQGKKSSSVKAGNNFAENFRTDINYIKSVINSISIHSSKSAKQEDIKQLVEPLLETGRKITNVEKKLDSCLKQEDFLNVENQMLKNIQIGNNQINATVHNVQQDIKNISKSQNNFKAETTNRLTILETKLKSISENTEMIQSLPGKIDGISQILADKGLQLKQDFPAINHDEETLAELADCGEKILQQLAIAARWYARKLPEIKAHDTEIKNLTAANENAVQQAHKAGEESGRKAIIKELLTFYDNLQSLMNPTEESAIEQVKTLANFLSNKGVEPIYQLREELEITNANLMNYEHNIANIKPGKIVITSPGYTFDSKTIEKAKFIFADEFSQVHATESLNNGFIKVSRPDAEVTRNLDTLASRMTGIYTSSKKENLTKG